MPNPIEPALTDEQWSSNLADVFDGYVNIEDGVIDIRLGGPAGMRDVTREIAALIALLNRALPADHPAKITPKWVRDILDGAVWVDRMAARSDDVAQLEALARLAIRLRAHANALASYLPARP